MGARERAAEKIQAELQSVYSFASLTRLGQQVARPPASTASGSHSKNLFVARGRGSVRVPVSPKEQLPSDAGVQEGRSIVGGEEQPQGPPILSQW